VRAFECLRIDYQVDENHHCGSSCSASSFRITRSTRRLAARPSGVTFEAIGRYSPYPARDSRAGLKSNWLVMWERTYVARAADSSQLDGKRAVLIGTLSVCPSIRIW